MTSCVLAAEYGFTRSVQSSLSKFKTGSTYQKSLDLALIIASRNGHANTVSVLIMAGAHVTTHIANSTQYPPQIRNCLKSERFSGSNTSCALQEALFRFSDGRPTGASDMSEWSTAGVDSPQQEATIILLLEAGAYYHHSLSGPCRPFHPPNSMVAHIIRHRSLNLIKSVVAAGADIHNRQRYMCTHVSRRP